LEIVLITVNLMKDFNTQYFNNEIDNFNCIHSNEITDLGTIKQHPAWICLENILPF
jgi:hypothetical protein